MREGLAIKHRRALKRLRIVMVFVVDVSFF